MRNVSLNNLLISKVKRLLPFYLFAFLPFCATAQEQLAVADAFQFCVRTDYTADGTNGMSRPYESRFGIEGWTNHMELALVLNTDMEQARLAGRDYTPSPETTAAAIPAKPVVYMTTPEGYQNVTFFSGDMQYAYVLYFAPSEQRSWLLVSRVGGGYIQPLYQLSNDLYLLDDSQKTAELILSTDDNRSANVDSFVNLCGRLASGQYKGINYIEK